MTDKLYAQAVVFADELTARIKAIVATDVELRAKILGEGADARVMIGAASASGVAGVKPLGLTINGEPGLQLMIKFYCCWDRTGKYLAVDKSWFSVRYGGKNAPLFRYEYVREPGKRIPGAHLHVHAHRDEMLYYMTAADHGNPRNRRRRGGVPHLAEVHFPLGGRRFRPCIEDVLELLIELFAIDTRPDYQLAIEDGRERWRRVQTKSVVRDDPDTAIEALRGMGCRIERPAVPPQVNRSQLIAY